MSDEELRILRAARDGRLSVNASGRYVIAGEPRPERKARERCLRRGWVRFTDWRRRLDEPLMLTDLGAAMLEREAGEA